MPVPGDLQFEIIAVQLFYSILQRTHIAAHNDWRVLRRHNHTDQLLRTHSSLRHKVGNKWRGKSHSGHNVKYRAGRMLFIQLLLESSSLFAPDAQQPGATYKRGAPSTF